MRRIRYQEIADDLRRAGDRVTGGFVAAVGGRAVGRVRRQSRVTIRRALELVREDGLIAARQGFGWFVAGEPVRQTLRIARHDRVAAGGRRQAVGAQDRGVRLRGAAERVRKVLGVDQVLRVKRVNLADGEPFAVVTVWCPAEPRREPVRAGTWSGARSTSCSTSSCEARPRPSAPTSSTSPTRSCSACPSVRRCCAASGSRPTGAGEPVLVSEHMFPAHRTEFVVELPQAEPSMTPSGLRLVD